MCTSAKESILSVPAWVPYVVALRERRSGTDSRLRTRVTVRVAGDHSRRVQTAAYRCLGALTLRMPPRAALTGNTEHRLFLEVLDSLGAGLAFFSCEGALLHGTSPLGRMLAQPPDGPMLQLEVQRFASDLSGMLETRAVRGQQGLKPLSERRVAGRSGLYRLQGSYVGTYVFDAPGTILVRLECPTEDPLSTDVLRSRWRLSERQAVVAQLLARGRTNEEISATVAISPHTVRRHTEQIMLKVGARTRAEIASVLLGI